MKPSGKHRQFSTILLLGSLRQNIHNPIARLLNRGRCVIAYSYSLCCRVAQIR